MTTCGGTPLVVLRSTVHKNLYFQIFLHLIWLWLLIPLDLQDFNLRHSWSSGTVEVKGVLKPWRGPFVAPVNLVLQVYWVCGFCATLGAQWGWEFQGSRFGLLKSITQPSELRLGSVSWPLSWDNIYYSAFCLPTCLCLSLNISVHGGMFFIMGLGFLDTTTREECPVLYIIFPTSHISPPKQGSM